MVKLAGFALSAAYTSVSKDANGLTVTNFGTGVKSPLYTQQVLNQVFIDGHFGDSDTWQVKGVYKGLGGKFVAQYASSSLETKSDDYAEFDFIYATKFNTSVGDIGAKAMWMNQSFPGPVAGSISKGRYKQRSSFDRFLRLLGTVLNRSTFRVQALPDSNLLFYTSTFLQSHKTLYV